MIEGSTHDEFTIFTAIAVESLVGPVTPALYPIVLGILLPTLGVNATVADVMNEYPLANYPSPGEAVSAVGTDAVFACPGRTAAKALSQFVKTYAYEFNDPNAPQVFIPPWSFPSKAYHARRAGIPVRLDDARWPRAVHARPGSAGGRNGRYWTNFARNGGPNGRGTPQWPTYSAANDTYQSLEPPTPKPTTSFAADHHCDFWNSL